MILFLLIVVRFPRTIKIVSMTSHCHFQHFHKIPWSQNWLKGKLTGNPCYILVVNAIVSSNVFLNYINQLSRNNPWNISIFASTSSTNQHVQSSHCFIIIQKSWFSHGKSHGNRDCWGHQRHGAQRGAGAPQGGTGSARSCRLAGGLAVLRRGAWGCHGDGEWGWFSWCLAWEIMVV